MKYYYMRLMRHVGHMISEILTKSMTRVLIADVLCYAILSIGASLFISCVIAHSKWSDVFIKHFGAGSKFVYYG